MKKRILTVAFVAAFLFSGAMLFQVENANAQDVTPGDATPVDAFPDLGVWVKSYNGQGVYWRDECWKSNVDKCIVGQWRRPQAADAEPVGINN